MANPDVYEIGRVDDIDGRSVGIGVDYDAVVIAGYRFNAEQAEGIAQLFSAACWAAARQQGKMAEAAS